MRFARWAAVSTREQTRKDSLPNQLEHTLQAGLEKGWVEAAGPFIVEGQSRQKYIQLYQAETEIAAMREMLDAARSGQFDILLMTEFDRLRVLLDQVFRTLASYKVQLYSLAQPIEPVPPAEYTIHKADTALMLIAMAQTASSLEISRTRRKWFENMPRRVTERGLPATSIAYGYRKPLGRETDRQAVPEQDPDLVPHLIKIKDLLLAGRSTSELVAYLVKQRLAPPKSDIWHKQTVRDILKNPFYAGTVRFGASRVVLDPKTDSRKRDRFIPSEKILTARGRHVPLWDEPTHQRILLEFKRRSRATYRGVRNTRFTGLVKCGRCGSSMWHNKNGPGRFLNIWRCSAKHCRQTIPDIVLVEEIGKALDPILSAYMPSPSQRKDSRKETYKDDINTLKRQLERLETAYLAGQFDLDRYAIRKRQIDRKLSDLRQAEVLQKQQDAEHAALLASIDEMKQTSHFVTWLETAPAREVSRGLHLILEKIVVTGNDIELVMKE